MTLAKELTTKNNVEQSWLSEIADTVDATLIALKGSSDNSVFLNAPDYQKTPTKFPVVIASVINKTESAVGMGKIGQEGKRQTTLYYQLAFGIVGRTAHEVGLIEEAIVDRFSSRHWLDIYNFTNGVKGDLINCGRMKMNEVDFSPSEGLAGNKVTMGIYTITVRKNL
jgi:hypothetical protein